MEPGGSHPTWGTENALIVLGDGTYLELLAVRGGATTAHRLWRRPDGTPRLAGTFGGFALAAADLDRVVAHLQAAGIPFSDPHSGTRLHPDGRRLEWRLAFPDPPELPFLIKDVTPRAERIPAPAPHTLNAAAGLARVSTVTSDLERTSAVYERLFGTARPPAFPVERGEITLRPARDTSEEAGIESITLRIPARHRGALPLVTADGALLIAPEAVGGLRIAVLPGDEA